MSLCTFTNPLFFLSDTSLGDIDDDVEADNEERRVQDFRGDFMNILNHGFSRVAVCIPKVKPLDPLANFDFHCEELDKVYAKGACYVLCPELGLSGYTCGDGFKDQTLLKNVLTALKKLLRASSTRWHDMLISVGAPLLIDNALFNCAVTLQNGKILAIVPKAYPPNYREFYEARWFARAAEALSTSVRLWGQDVPFGTDILIEAKNMSGFVLHNEVCEDIWTPIPPSAIAALMGATVLANLSASNITIGKDAYREQLVAVSSAKNLAVQMYSAAGFGESTADMSWDGTGFIAERGDVLQRAKRFSRHGEHIVTDIDLLSLVEDRVQQSSWHQNAVDHKRPMRKVQFMHRQKFVGETVFDTFLRDINPLPFVPSDPKKREEHCYETFMIQSMALVRKLLSLPEHMRKVIIGVSGGQDSTHALSVAAHAMDELGLPRSNIIAPTMPGFGTSDRTYENACKLIEAIGATFREIDIKSITTHSWANIGVENPEKFAETVKAIIEARDNSQRAKLLKTLFENNQAWLRTHTLFATSGLEGGIVLGTGDMSELLIGWCTMFGDHSSHYGINAGVPKTLITHMIRFTKDVIFANEPAVQAVLQDVLNTPISPELLPLNEDGTIAQVTEETVGPYELTDFYAFHTVRWGNTPERIVRMALHAFDGKEHAGRAVGLYTVAEHKFRMDQYLGRWIGSQFKRNCLPDGPKVFLMDVSPRSGLRLPSDADAIMWRKRNKEYVPEMLPLAA